MRAILSALIALFSFTASTARADAFTAVEGYVFNRTTVKPVSNVRLRFEACLDQGARGYTEAVTDANGFYQVGVGVLANYPSVSKTVIAYCPTSKGPALSTIAVYNAFPSAILRRDLYLDLSSKIHSCGTFNPVDDVYPTTCPPEGQ